jgi:hypothetical protein
VSEGNRDVKIVRCIRVACLGGGARMSRNGVGEQNGGELNKESDGERLVGRRRGELRKKLKGGCSEC